MKKTVALDVQSLFENNKTGIGWTVKQLVDQLTNCRKFQFQLNYFGKFQLKNEKQILENYIDKGCIAKRCPWMELPIYRRIWNFIPIPYNWMFGKNAEITQFFNYVIPPGVKGKKVLFIYDMAYKAYPETISERTKADLNRNLQISSQRADIICTISEFSKSEIVKYLNVPEEKIKIVSCGVNRKLFHTQYSDDAVRNVKEKYNISGSYFLYLGTLEPRKNVLKIIQAYNLFRKRNEKCPKLVIAGKKGWLYEDIFAYVKSQQIENLVIFTGYVESNEVPVLMRGATTFLFPSLYEGFGLPVLEAMSCGTPVITSYNTSLREVAGDAGLLVNPESEEQIAECMQKINDNADLCRRLSEKGLKQSAKFTWEEAAKTLSDLYMKL